MTAENIFGCSLAVIAFATGIIIRILWVRKDNGKSAYREGYISTFRAYAHRAALVRWTLLSFGFWGLWFFGQIIGYSKWYHNLVWSWWGISSLIVLGCVFGYLWRWKTEEIIKRRWSAYETGGKHNNSHPSEL